MLLVAVTPWRFRLDDCIVINGNRNARENHYKSQNHAPGEIAISSINYAALRSSQKPAPDIKQNYPFIIAKSDIYTIICIVYYVYIIQYITLWIYYEAIFR